MTGGVVVVLHRVGKNFAAGMSGGLAFVHDEAGALAERHNTQMSSAERLSNADEIASLRQLIERHAEFTGIPYAQQLLNHWTRPSAISGNWFRIRRMPASRHRFCNSKT